MFYTLFYVIKPTSSQVKKSVPGNWHKLCHRLRYEGMV